MTRACLVILLCAGAAFSASAQTQRLRPGLWQSSITMKGQGAQTDDALAQMQQQMASLPPEQRKMVEEMLAKQGVGIGPKGTTVKVCLSKDDVERDEIAPRDGCTQAVKRSGNTMHVAFQCQGNPPSSGEGQITVLSATAYSGELSSQTIVNGKPVKTQMSQAGQWLGADCGTLQPIKR